MRTILTKCIAALLTAVALITASASGAFAYDSYVVLDGFQFVVNDSHEAVIQGYDNSDAHPSIPDKLLGANVAEIDNYAFFGDAEIMSVSFDNAVYLRRIGDNAFYGCANITALSFPDSLTDLGFGAFQNCPGLKSIEWGSGISEIGGQVFKDCSSLKEVIFPEHIAKIGDNAFYGCASLESAVIPDTVTAIGYNAFSNCPNLTIYCYKDSVAHSYAVENNIPYDFIDRYADGDVDRNGKVNISDVTYIQLYRVGLYEIEPYAGRLLGDVNQDGKITLRDATLIQLRLIGLY